MQVWWRCRHIGAGVVKCHGVEHGENREIGERSWTRALQAFGLAGRRRQDAGVGYGGLRPPSEQEARCCGGELLRLRSE